jgi:hypothetical protein
VDVPDEIDISDMRSNGMQPDEQLLPDTPGLYFLFTCIAVLSSTSVFTAVTILEILFAIMLLCDLGEDMHRMCLPVISPFAGGESIHLFRV